VASETHFRLGVLIYVFNSSCLLPVCSKLVIVVMWFSATVWTYGMLKENYIKIDNVRCCQKMMNNS